MDFWNKVQRVTPVDYLPDSAADTKTYQIYDKMPFLEPLFHPKERAYSAYSGLCVNGHCGGHFFAHYMWVPFALSVAYVVLAFGGRRFMASKEPFALNTALSAWNLLLAIFSLVGAMRVVPQILLNLHEYGVEYTICHRADQQYGMAASGMWTMLFVLSKPFELVDTAFIVLRKKPLIFLHWVSTSLLKVYFCNLIVSVTPPASFVFYHWHAQVLPEVPLFFSIITSLSWYFVGILMPSNHQIPHGSVTPTT